MTSAMDGRDGAVVQADLRAVIDRAKDARTVLGLGPAAGLDEARAAFHGLCKKYHPARFARSSPETVRLANEAFLAIKRAYDGLVRPEAVPKPIEPAPSRPTSTLAPPTVGKPIPTPVPRVTAPMRAIEPAPPQRPGTQGIEQVRPAGKAPRKAGDRPTDRLPAQLRTPLPRTEKIAAMPRPTSGPNAPTQAIPTTPAAAALTEEQRFAAALDLLRRRLWKDAEKALGELAVAHATERRYRAYRHYAKGRMSQDDGRLDEARAEWERALRLDPDLQVAKGALEQLPEQPKPPSGGLFSKLFKRS